MAIRIEDSPEPLSERSLNPTGAGQPLLVESEVTRVLQQELQRYCEGNIAGRSFLIAGHRGAGKTTLVAKAFLDTWLACERKAEFLRPLFIPLHGPSLFPPVEPASPAAPKPPPAESATPPPPTADAKKPAAAEKPPAGEEKPAAKPAAEEKGDAQIALEQITLGLHRAVAKEFVSRYYARTTDLAYLRYQEQEVRASLVQFQTDRVMAAPGVPYPTADDFDRLLGILPPRRELAAQAAQFEIELYEGPSPQRLHELWARVDAVSGGVLFSQGYAPLMRGIPAGRLAQPPAGLRLDLPGIHGQGIRELVAISGVVEAYRRISGDVKRSAVQKDELTRSEERSSGLDLGGKELVAPVAALLTGAIAGAGAAASNPGHGFEAVLSGLLAAFGAGVVFKMSKSRKRDRTIAREEQFIADLSVATLDRVLPLLIERLREAGLAPVFVVDELDKVPQLGARIIAMVHHLKKLVAENAFFCFLANRSYFEEMLTTGAGRPYPVEYTYYTHRLFVVFSPEDFERYLRRRIPDPLPPAAPVPAAPTQAASPEHTRETAACALLRWVLRHRAQLHVVDLQREIAALRGGGAEVTTAPEELVSSPRYRIDATFQVAIEMRLAQPKVQQAVKDRPEIRRLLNDAMYYLTRRWIAGDETVDLSPNGFEAFKTYLEERTGREEERQSGGQVPAAAAGAAALRGLNPRDCRFLFDEVGLLADFLSDRSSVDPTVPPGTSPRHWRREMLDAWNERREACQLPRVEGSVWDALFRDTESLLVRLAPTSSWTYGFRYDPASATPRGGPPAEAPLSAREVAAARRQTRKRERPIVVDSKVLADVELIAAFAVAVDRLQADPAAKKGAVADDKRARAGKKESPRMAVDLETLASQFAVVSLSPAWSVVQAAVGRLLDAKGRATRYSTQGEDELYVRQFRDLLVRNAQRIGSALACAAFIGQGTSTSRASSVVRGLTAISSAHGFSKCDEEGVRQALENVTAQIKETFGIDVVVADVAIDAAGDIGEYERVVGAAILRAEGVISRGNEIVIADRAWGDLFDRLERWVATGQPGAPEVVELLAAALEKGPSRFIRYDPREMTIADWVRLLAGTRPRTETALPLPSWLAPFAMHALGIHGVALGTDAARQWFRVPAGQAPDAEKWRRIEALFTDRRLFAGQLPSTTLVVIRRTVSPKLATLLPSPGIAGVVATPAELEAILGDRGTNSLPLAAPSEQQVVAVEMEPELSTKLETDLYPALAGQLSRPWIVHVYWEDRGREMRHPYVVNPAGLAEIVDAAAKEHVPLPRRA